MHRFWSFDVCWCKMPVTSSRTSYNYNRKTGVIGIFLLLLRFEMSIDVTYLLCIHVCLCRKDQFACSILVKSILTVFTNKSTEHCITKHINFLSYPREVTNELLIISQRETILEAMCKMCSNLMDLILQGWFSHFPEDDHFVRMKWSRNLLKHLPAVNNEYTAFQTKVNQALNILALSACWISLYSWLHWSLPCTNS